MAKKSPTESKSQGSSGASPKPASRSAASRRRTSPPDPAVQEGGSSTRSYTEGALADWPEVLEVDENGEIQEAISPEVFRKAPFEEAQARLEQQRRGPIAAQPPLPVRIAWSRRELSQRFAAIAAELEAVQNLAAAMGNGVLTDHPAQARIAADLAFAAQHAENYYRSLGKALGALEV